MTVPNFKITETPACACGHAIYKQRAEGLSQRNPPNYPFRLLECRHCRLVRTLPVPSEQTYGHGDEATRERIEHESDYFTFARVLLTDIMRWRGSGRLLDVGCNIGVLVEVASQLGFDAHGVDLDPVAIAYGQARGRPVYLSSAERPELSRPFDVVIVNHVLEHVADLAGFLAEMSAYLPEGGLLIVNVPNYGGWIPRLMKENWGALWPHQHVWQFTPSTLTATVESLAPFKLLARDTSHNLEPPSGTSLKGLAKDLVIRVSQIGRQADELRAVFQRIASNASISA